MLWVTGMDVNGFLLDLGQVFELKNAVAAAKFGASKPVRAFSAADVARIAHIARRHLIVAINKVQPRCRLHTFSPLETKARSEAFPCHMTALQEHAIFLHCFATLSGCLASSAWGNTGTEGRLFVCAMAG